MKAGKKLTPKTQLLFEELKDATESNMNDLLKKYQLGNTTLPYCFEFLQVTLKMAETLVDFDKGEVLNNNNFIEYLEAELKSISPEEGPNSTWMVLSLGEDGGPESNDDESQDESEDESKDESEDDSKDDSK
ncbi:unnamed protein product [Rhizoctonia solani]|uniref:Uncharacterized protein n=1 Tax=Rhizoctonia solani TaxID=456999 RepID=A0A8H3BQS0_9AGAM|nr:unnamed protein product [Rhizoctonia solani]